MKGFIIIFFSLCFTNIAANDPNEGQDVQNIQIDENKEGLENLRLLFKENEEKNNNELKDLKLLFKENEDKNRRIKRFLRAKIIWSMCLHISEI